MSKYFKIFPKTVYSLQNTATSLDTVTNLTSKFGFEKEFKNNTTLYYEYSITDGETPEVLAHKLYGDSEKHWIILSLNDIFNPATDWPLEYRNLMDVIEKKYVEFADTEVDQTGLEWAQANIHSYYKIETQTNPLTDDKFIYTSQIDSNTYANVISSSSNYTLQNHNVITIAIDKETKTYYDYEIDENEKKRVIKILKPEYVDSVDNEFRGIFN